MKLRVITNSERGSFACQRRWNFAYNERLTTRETSAPLRQGSLFHQCLELVYSGIRDFSSDRSVEELQAETLRAIFVSVIEPWIEKRQFYIKENLDPDLWSDSMESDDQIVATTMMMVNGYVSKFFENDLKNWEILGVECQVAREIFDPGTGRQLTINRRRVVYGGAVDLVVRDKNTGLNWIVEHKTTSDRDLDRYCRKLHFDPQIRGYPWALERPHKAADIKEPIQVAGVIYNVARKKVPTIPRVLKNGKVSTDKRIDTTREVFESALIGNGQNDFSEYQEILESLERNSFFHRETYTLTPADLKDFEIDMSHDAIRMKAVSKPDQYHPRQVQICTGPASFPCDFRSICIQDGEIARQHFKTKTIRHAELKGDLAEPAPDEKERSIMDDRDWLQL